LNAGRNQDLRVTLLDGEGHIAALREARGDAQLALSNERRRQWGLEVDGGRDVVVVHHRGPGLAGQQDAVPCVGVAQAERVGGSVEVTLQEQLEVPPFGRSLEAQRET